MTTGSLCFTEILKSWKPCSSKSEASQTADSTSASGVALPYFLRIPGSRDPALTPMRMEVPWSLAAAAISLTWSSNLRMLPGLTRTAAQPASMAAKTYLGWKWMSAITGICDFLAIAGSASASSWLGHATRTMSQPDAVSSAICCRVALMSVVGVVHIDCTEMGASPPTSTLPTLILRVLRRGASTGGGRAGIPSPTVMVEVSPRGTMVPTPAGAGSAELDGLDEVGVDEQGGHHDEHRRHGIRDGQCLGDIHVPGVGAVQQPGGVALQSLPQGPGDVAAVQGQQRDQVED